MAERHPQPRPAGADVTHLEERPSLGRAVHRAATEDAFAAGELVAERYEIRRLVGRGGMGEVYEALDRELGGVVALGTLRSERADAPRAAERLRR